MTSQDFHHPADARFGWRSTLPALPALPATSGLVRFALIATYLSAATTTWNGTKIGSVRLGDIFLLLALLAFVAADARQVIPRIPSWAWLLGAIIVVVCVAHEMLPTSQAYLETRYVYFGNGVLPYQEAQSNIGVGIKFLAPVIGLPLMFAFAFRHDRRAPHRAMYAFAIGSVISSLVGFSDARGLTHLGASINHIPVGDGRAAGLAVQSNFLAMTAVLSLPVILNEIVSRTPRARIIGVLCLLALGLGIYSSGSRAGGAVGAGAIVLSVLVLPRYRRILPTVALLLAAALGLAFVAHPSLGASLLKAVRLNSNDASAQGSDQARSLVNSQAIRDFQHSPIDGVGLQVAGEAHNVYLQALAAGGLILLVGYVLFLGGAIVKSLQLARADDRLYPLFVAAVSGVIFNSVTNALTDRVAFVPLAIIAGYPLLGARREPAADGAAEDGAAEPVLAT